MKCTWCGKGEGKNYTKNREGDIYYYYCKECLGDIEKPLPFKELEELD